MTPDRPAARPSARSTSPSSRRIRSTARLNGYAQVLLLLADALNAAKSDKTDDAGQGAAGRQVRGLERHDQLHARRGPVLAAVDAADAGDPSTPSRRCRSPMRRSSTRPSSRPASGCRRRSTDVAERRRWTRVLLSQYVLSGRGHRRDLQPDGPRDHLHLQHHEDDQLGDGRVLHDRQLRPVRADREPVRAAAAGTWRSRWRWRPCSSSGWSSSDFSCDRCSWAASSAADEYATIITIALMVFFRNLAIVLGGPNQYAPPDYARPVTLGTLPISGNRFVALISDARAARPLLPGDQEDVDRARAARAAQNRVGIQTAGIDVLRPGHARVRRRRGAGGRGRRAPGARLPRLSRERRHLDLQRLRDHRHRRARLDPRQHRGRRAARA